ncbi:MAG: fused MFS/spermidine synthase [Patescibacteria group bacterium]|jgi:spermidine synthase
MPKKYVLEISIFVSGAVVMILELLGSRMFAPFFGNSLIVWTNLIGIVMASLSIGYWFGGRIADKEPTYKKYSVILFVVGLLIFLVYLLQLPVLVLLQNNIVDIRYGSILAGVILLAPASAFLGMVSPYAVRLKMKDIKASGATVGRLYAISTFGSIAGTFLAGFWLIARLGTSQSIVLLSLVAIALSVVVWTDVKFLIIRLVAITIIAIGALSFRVQLSGVVADIDTQYSRALIYDSVEEISSRNVRTIAFVPGEAESAMYEDNPDELVSDYTKFFRIAGFLKPDQKRTLLIGGGTYMYPRDYLKQFPESEMDVVEIDPEMTDIAKKYFSFKEDPRLNIYHEDGRTFINRSKASYDAIFLDAFKSYNSVPFYLATRESLERIRGLLSENGVVVTNIVSALEGENARFFEAEYVTLKSVFPSVSIFRVSSGSSNQDIQNIILVAARASVDLGQAVKYSPTYADKIVDKDAIKSGALVLTDNFAPVDQYLFSLNLK